MASEESEIELSPTWGDDDAMDQETAGRKKKLTGWKKKPALAPRPILEVAGGAPM